MKEEARETMKEILRTAVKVKPEAKKIERPLEKDYFEYRGNQIIVDYGHATNFIDAQDDYIDQLTSECDEQLEVIAKDIKIIEKQYQELQTLKDAVKEIANSKLTIGINQIRAQLKTLAK